LTTLAPAEWYERYGKRIEESHLPRKPIEREEFAALVGADGFKLMEAVYSSEAPTVLRHCPQWKLCANYGYNSSMHQSPQHVCVQSDRPPVFSNPLTP